MEETRGKEEEEQKDKWRKRGTGLNGKMRNGQEERRRGGCDERRG